ncbi:phosphoadenosine phosphosulfate reductase family protein [Bacillus pumilus]|uniref:phosphoadenosine phosphosulfate reductase family protein n=1 Tax=Bacillus pumilus TaxID=1408 RepID=UPI003CFD98B7
MIQLFKSIVDSYEKQIDPYQEEYYDEVTQKNKKQWLSSRANKETRYAIFNKKQITIEDKLNWAVELIKMALSRSVRPVVSCSFGIDSILTLYLSREALKEMGRDPSDIDVVWNDTKNEFQDVRQYAKELQEKWNIRLIKTAPKKVLKKIISDHGGVDSSYFFTRKGDRRNGRPLSEKCCGTLKHEPMKRATKENNWDLIINGLRADESTQRLRAGLRDGDYFYSVAEWKSYVCRPIQWITEEELWDIVKKLNIPYNGLYDKNLIQKYPDQKNIYENYNFIKSIGLDPEEFLQENIQTVDRYQAVKLEKIGFKIFTPRTGCQMCPIPVKYGYLHWMRTYYPKVYDAMVHNLGYGKALIEMIPIEIQEEIREFTGIDIQAENAHEYLKEILEVKPCALDGFNQK